MLKWMTRKKIHPAPKIKNVQVQGLRLIPQYFLDQPPRPTPVTFQRYHTLSYKLRCYTRISSPEKSLNNTRKKNTISFHLCLASPISCWHVTRLSRYSIRLMNERQSLYHSQSEVVCQRFFRIMAVKTLKNSYRLQTVTFKLFSRRGRKPKYEKKNRKLRIQWLWWWHSS